MKRLLRLILLSIVLIFSSLQAAWEVAGLPVTLSVCEGNLVREKAVFKAAFTAAYQGTEIDGMVRAKYGSLNSFLEVAFEDEELDFSTKKTNTLFISAKDKRGDIIGFVAFDKNLAADSGPAYI